MRILEVLALLLVLAAVFGFLNYKLARLPSALALALALALIALLASAALIAIDLVADLALAEMARQSLRAIDHSRLMQPVLCGLLFAAALHAGAWRPSRTTAKIAMLAATAALISAFFVAGSLWLVSVALNSAIPFAWALVFGALISAADPIAVLGMLKIVRGPQSLQAKVTGESLFGVLVALIVFGIALAYAVGAPQVSQGAATAARFFAGQILGGALLGAVFGSIALAMLRWVDERNLEILITLALVTATCAAALSLQISAPIAALAAGLLLGNRSQFALSETSHARLGQFWMLGDGMLKAALFLLIGFETLVTGFDRNIAMLAALAIPIVLVGRWTSLVLPVGLLQKHQLITPGAMRLLTWGGLRGGISVALALSLPFNAFTQPLLAATAVVVLFSLIVQAFTVRPLVKRLIEFEVGADLHGDMTERKRPTRRDPEPKGPTRKEPERPPAQRDPARREPKIDEPGAPEPEPAPERAPRRDAA